MSAFMVDKITIDRAICCLHRNATRHGGAWRGLQLGDTFYRSEDDFTALGAKLYALNHAAVSGRYGNRAPEMFGDVPPYTFAWVPFAVPMVQLYKSLQCLLYQMAEEPVYDGPEYKALREIEGEVARAIVSDLPAYDKAVWG